jgi:hypothetical protein
MPRSSIITPFKELATVFATAMELTALCACLSTKMVFRHHLSLGMNHKSRHLLLREASLPMYMDTLHRYPSMIKGWCSGVENCMLFRSQRTRKTQIVSIPCYLASCPALKSEPYRWISTLMDISPKCSPQRAQCNTLHVF